MGRIELTTAQRHLLTALVDAYQETESPVGSTAVADAVGREPETVRNRMQGLKSLGLVEGVTGPHGGYEPTEAAFEALDRTDADARESVVLASGYDRVPATVAEIDFANVHDPTSCRAHVHFRQPLDDVAVGDAVVVGPTPVGDLVVAGTVEAVDDDANTVYVDVARLEAPVTDEG